MTEDEPTKGWRYYAMDLIIVGIGLLGLAWLFYCALYGIDPVGWFRTQRG